MSTEEYKFVATVRAGSPGAAAQALAHFTSHDAKYGVVDYDGIDVAGAHAAIQQARRSSETGEWDEVIDARNALEEALVAIVGGVPDE